MQPKLHSSTVMVRISILAIAALILVFTAAAVRHATAQVPETIAFQGSLTDSGGIPVDTMVAMTFKLYKGGVAVWTETHASVEVVGGRFEVALGTVTPLDTVAFNEDIEIGLKIGTDAETAPRTALSSSPYAFSLRGLRVVPAVSTNGPSLIGGHSSNSIPGGVEAATIAGGGSQSGANSVHGSFGTVGGGNSNSVTAEYGTISGGAVNTAANLASVGGGLLNTASGEGATIAGGGLNTSSGYSAAVGGGGNNTSSGRAATIAGGEANTASGRLSAVPGGQNNAASGVASLAAGTGTLALHDGSFVWADRSDTTATFASTGDNQFLIRAAGGVGIGKVNPQEALDVAGNARVTGHYSYASTRTFHYQIPAAVLHRSRFAENPDGVSRSPSSDNIFGYLALADGGFGADTVLTLTAVINLPDSVTLTAFKMYYFDNDGSNDIAFSAYVNEKEVGTATAQEPVAEVGLTTSGSQSSVQTANGIVYGGSTLIQNQQFFYYLSVTISRFSYGSFTPDLRLYGFTLEYTSDRINY